MFKREEKTENSKPVIKQEETPNTGYIPRVTVDELPSGFKTYPKGCEISYRPYSYGEVKAISGSQNVDARSGIRRILEGVTTSFPKEDLTVGDALYLGLLRKLSTMGTAKVKAFWKCSRCGAQGTYVTQQDEFEFTDMKAPSLPVKLTLSTGEYEFMPLTVGDYFKLVEDGRENDAVSKLAHECRNRSLDDAYKTFFDVVNAEDAALLEKVDEYLFHELKPIEIQCTGKDNYGERCQSKIKLELDVGEQIILPFREERQESLDNRIHFGEASSDQSLGNQLS